MAKKTCDKGHIYDSSIYGDNCPFCPSSDKATVAGGGGETVAENFSATAVNPGSGGTQVGGDHSAYPTILMGGGQPAGGNVGGTVIRPAGDSTGISTGKRIAGLLITYDLTPAGQVFNIHEGRNHIGRDAACEIVIQDDSQISGKHFSILYRPVDRKFKFKDEQSSNGTFLNEVLTDEGELNNFDVIRIGSTRLIFIAIPQLA